MMTQNKPRVRFRVNVTRLAKGNFTFDCTAEVDTEFDKMNLAIYRDLAVTESDLLVAALEARYPLNLDVKE